MHCPSRLPEKSFKMMTMNNHENGIDYSNGYMEPEEEWEREGLLDPAWEKQQKKVSPICFCKIICTRIL